MTEEEKTEDLVDTGKKVKFKRIGMAPRTLLEILGGLGKAGRTSLKFDDLRTLVKARGYDLTKTDGSVMSVSDLNKQITRAKNWLAEELMANPTPGLPTPHGHRKGNPHIKPKSDNPKEDKEYKTKRKAYVKHRAMIVKHLFERTDGKGVIIPEIKVPANKFASTSDLYGFLNDVSGSSSEIL